MRLSPVLNAPSVCLQGPGEAARKDLRGVLCLLLFTGRASYYGWEAKGRAPAQRVKTWEFLSFFPSVLACFFFLRHVHLSSKQIWVGDRCQLCHLLSASSAPHSALPSSSISSSSFPTNQLAPPRCLSHAGIVQVLGKIWKREEIKGNTLITYSSGFCGTYLALKYTPSGAVESSIYIQGLHLRHYLLLLLVGCVCIVTNQAEKDIIFFSYDKKVFRFAHLTL